MRQPIATGVAGVDVCAPVRMAAAREHCTHASQANRFLPKQLMFFKASKKYCASFSIQVRDNGSFHCGKKKVGGGFMGVQRRQEREGGRERETDSPVQHHTGLSLFHFRAEFEQPPMKKVAVKSADGTGMKMKRNSANPVCLGLPCTILIELKLHFETLFSLSVFPSFPHFQTE